MKHPNIVLFLAEDLDFEGLNRIYRADPGPESLRLINTKTDRPASDSCY